MKKLLLIAAVAAFAAPAQAGVVYSNDFEAENGGTTQVNYNGFNGLTVTDGTVDLVHTGDGFGLVCPQGTACVDLDGSTGDAGIVSSTAYAFDAGDLVTLAFTITGNQRSGTDDLTISFLFGGTVSGTYGFSSSVAGGSFDLGAFSGTQIDLNGFGFPPDYGPDDVTFYFRADNGGSAAFSFTNPGGDNIGVLLDAVSLDVTAVPEPATWAMMIGGIGAAGGSLRRRKVRAAIA